MKRVLVFETAVQLHLQLLLLCLLLIDAPLVSIASSIKRRDNPLGIDYDPAPPPDKGPPLSAGALRDPAYLPAEIGGILGAYVLVVGLISIALYTVGRRLRRGSERCRMMDVEMTKAPASVTTPVSPRSPQTNFSRPSPEKADRNPYVFPVNAQSREISPVGDPSVDARIMAADREHMDKGLQDLYVHVMAQEEAKIRSRTESNFPAAQPQRANIKPTKGKQEGMTVNTSAKVKPQSRASSIISSLKSPRKKNGGRSMQISSPLSTPLSKTTSPKYASDEEPLSPVYAVPPPPVPEGQAPYSHSRNVSYNDFSPITPESPVNPDMDKQPFPLRHNVDPQLNPPSLSITTSSNKPPSGNPLNSHPTPKSSAPSLVPTNNSTRTLPFRAYDPPAGLQSPTFSHTTRTTVLERTTPLSPGNKTPWTGACVPYSPYQPHTPVTPFSPRLVTKQERKLRKKIDGRTPVTEMCKSEEDLWDSAY